MLISQTWIVMFLVITILIFPALGFGVKSYCIRYAIISVICTLLSYPTMFLIITIFIFPALGFAFGVKSYRLHMREKTNPKERKHLIAALPMLFAVASFFLEMYFIDTGYNV